MRNRHAQRPKIRFITTFDSRLDKWEIRRARSIAHGVNDKGEKVTVECKGDHYLDVPVPGIGWIIEDDTGNRARVREINMSAWGDIAVILEAE